MFIESAIIEALTWLGIDFPTPTNQLSKLERYQALAKQLVQQKKAYVCTCSPQRLATLREKQKASNITPHYDGFCRDKNHTLASGATIRISLQSSNDTITYKDKLRGLLSINKKQLDDFIIMRSNNVPTFNFAVIVDDHDQAISHVIRGDDHISNTFKQVVIADYLCFAPPVFAHLPLVLNLDGTVLSKRDAAANILSYRDQGYLPESLLNYLLRLGWAKQNLEFIPINDAIKHFSFEGLNRSAAKIDSKKLLWLNKTYLKHYPPEVIKPMLDQSFSSIPDQTILKAIELFKSRAEQVRDIEHSLRTLFSKESAPPLPEGHPTTQIADRLEQCYDRLNCCAQWDKDTIQNAISSFITDHSLTIKDIVPYLRFALLKELQGPSVPDTLVLLGKKEALAKIKNLLAQCRSAS